MMSSKTVKNSFLTSVLIITLILLFLLQKRLEFVESWANNPVIPSNNEQAKVKINSVESNTLKVKVTEGEGEMNETELVAEFDANGNLLPANPTDTTIVTGFFEIGRFERGADWYLSFMKSTLMLPAPYVIFAEAKNMDSIKAMPRPDGFPTLYIVKELSELHYYKYVDRVKEIQANETYKKVVAHQDRIECVNPYYAMVMFSKFPLVLEASEKKLWAGKKYVWMDAGASRFFATFDLNVPWTGARITDKLMAKIFDGKDGRRTYMVNHLSTFFPYTWDYIQPRMDPYKISTESIAVIAGTMFAGTKKAFEVMHNEMLHVWNDFYLNQGVINNDQVGMLIVSYFKPEAFDLISHSETVVHWLRGAYLDYWGFHDFLKHLRGDKEITNYPPVACFKLFWDC